GRLRAVLLTQPEGPKPRRDIDQTTCPLPNTGSADGRARRRAGECRCGVSPGGDARPGPQLDRFRRLFRVQHSGDAALDLRPGKGGSAAETASLCVDVIRLRPFRVRRRGGADAADLALWRDQTVGGAPAPGLP